ncbi:N-acetyl-gamma-glutamyl-phosphate reductase [Dehalococcoides mccartyi]|jgi:N-acetyl-gamma-glutamyl-phosphate reductase|uniref:N-acetyl-gamma-glutamyl-phosphate reductase n=1 Tax=Dehalococcoides mccartyi TaxID=61435 RepID=UPI0004E0A94A|nr:N-acetyl-gamma-glutamyl-phosphate reductase [Dehalococcoides mccartyi]AII58626.1 N-acetyl-gamma-glutamyl-phosphate reductase [Dehalococcoides mccartyi CG1]APH11741.1 N-acetyl-gamma-glutamyl-phosphate reductase [Dehalococcoides mccartyi]
MKKYKAGIINVTGYAGLELARILASHPSVELCSVTGRSLAGKKLSDAFPYLHRLNLPITENLEGQVDIVFMALPHKEGAVLVSDLLAKGIRIIDISADFRLKDPSLYQAWYGFEHPCPELLPEAVYGLPELKRKDIASARLVANPGCYPTSAILGLTPAFKMDLIEPSAIIDAKSGLSGSGRTPTAKNIFCEADEDVCAYSVGSHRHQPEIVQELSYAGGGVIPRITFCPHLIPMSRGILSSAYARLKRPVTDEEVKEIYHRFYKDEPFVKITAEPPHTRYTRGTNMCFIHPVVDALNERLVVISCIDNLVKGAAGQAVQNMNIMLGLDESAGLEAMAALP